MWRCARPSSERTRYARTSSCTRRWALRRRSVSVSSLAELAQALVRVESINPSLDPSGSGEYPAARVVAEWCERAGLEVELEEVAPGRPNVVAVARGSGGGRTLLLNGHLDTVGLLAPDAGLAPRIDGGRLYGR